MSERDALVRVRGLEKHFPVETGMFGRVKTVVRALEGVSFDVRRGETFGIAGESGCGKTTLGRTMLRLIEPTAGSVEIDGKDIFQLDAEALKRFRRHIQIVFQDPASSLNPRRNIKDIITEPLRVHEIGTKAERENRVSELLEMVNLPSDIAYKYPSSLSGGQKQRVGLARAVATNPKFIVFDEPTSSLDVSVQARIIHILDQLQDEMDLTSIFITHDLPLLRHVADRIGIMYMGRFMEIGETDAVFRNPENPYTRALLSSILTVTEEERRVFPEKIRLDGSTPDPREKPSGCPFRTRCPEAFDACATAEPELYDVGPEHLSRCFLHDEEFAP